MSRIHPLAVVHSTAKIVMQSHRASEQEQASDRRRCFFSSRLVLLGLTLLVSCREVDEKGEAPHTDTLKRPGVVTLDQDQRARLGIVCEPVRKKVLRDTLQGVGWLQAPPATEVVLRAPVAGFVVSADDTWPTLGQEVELASKIGSVNVFLSPQEVAQLIQAKKDTEIQIQQSLVSMQISEQQFKRASEARDAVTGVRLDQLKVDFERSKAAYREALNKMPFLIQEPTEDGVLMKPVPIACQRPGTEEDSPNK